MTSHEPLTDKMVLHFFELKKLPPLNSTDNSRDLWLKLFKADTVEELEKIEEMGVPIMSEAIVAYRHVSASPEFKAIERMRSKARHDEAQALSNAAQQAAESERAIWQGVVAEKDTEIAEKDTEIAEKDTEIAVKDTEIAVKDTEIAEKDAENTKLRAKIAELSALIDKK